MYITGYGIDAEYPYEGLPGVEQLRANQYITLWDEEFLARSQITKYLSMGEMESELEAFLIQME